MRHVLLILTVSMLIVPVALANAHGHALVLEDAAGDGALHVQTQASPWAPQMGAHCERTDILEASLTPTPDGSGIIARLRVADADARCATDPAEYVYGLGYWVDGPFGRTGSWTYTSVDAENTHSRTTVWLGSGWYSYYGGGVVDNTLEWWIPADIAPLHDVAFYANSVSCALMCVGGNVALFADRAPDDGNLHYDPAAPPS